MRCPVDSIGSRGPNSIRQAKEKAWPSFSCMPRNLPDEFIRVDDEVPLFSGCWVPKAKRVDSDDEVPLFSEGWAPKEKRDSDDDVPLFP